MRYKDKCANTVIFSFRSLLAFVLLTCNFKKCFRALHYAKACNSILCHLNGYIKFKTVCRKAENGNKDRKCMYSLVQFLQMQITYTHAFATI